LCVFSSTGKFNPGTIVLIRLRSLSRFVDALSDILFIELCPRYEGPDWGPPATPVAQHKKRLSQANGAESV